MSSASAQSLPEPSPLPRQALRRVSAVDALVEVLRDAILDGALIPGRAITEQDVVSAYDVSRPTAKAALRALTASRFLRQEPNKSAVVATPSAEDVVDLFRLRIPIELEIVREIVTSRAVDQAGYQLSDDVHVAVDEMWALVDQEAKPHEFVAADLRFHKALAESAGSERLLNCFGELEGELHLSMLQSYTYLDRAAIAQQHETILSLINDAIAEGKGEWKPAKQAMKEHLRTARRLIREGLTAQSTG